MKSTPVHRCDQWNIGICLDTAVPHVLSFDAELVLDARGFERPVNYLLVWVKPPEGVVIDPMKRPFVVVDPRAGHGPGIGGFKADSEPGMAMRADHPSYFVGFTPEPMPDEGDEAPIVALFIWNMLTDSYTL